MVVSGSYGTRAPCLLAKDLALSRMPQRRRAGTAVAVTLALATSGLTVAASPAAAVPAPDSTIFINEIHYDNGGTDTGEFIEVAGPVGTDLSGWTVSLYNGNNGASYDSDVLPATIPASGVVVVEYPSNGIQNGSPDAVALVDAAGAVVQFLSYEGAFSAVDGPANGLTSTDIGVAEAGTEPAGQSLQLTGTGSTYSQFTWTGPAAQSLGAANTGQVFSANDVAGPVATCPATLSTPAGTDTSADLTATSADAQVVAAAISSTPTAGITLTDFQASVSDSAAATVTLTVADATAAGEYPVTVTFTDDASATGTCTVDVTVREAMEPTPISTIQGTGGVSALDGQTLTVQAVVTSIITANDAVTGFYVQERDATSDGDPATSEGMYVFCDTGCPAGLAAGDLVLATGVVDEFFDNTQIATSGPDGDLSVVDKGLALPTAAVITLPAQTSTRDAATFEAVEGMRTTISTTLAVSEYFNLARFGEVVLTAEERPYQFTQLNEPSVEGNAAYLADLSTRRIVLDDDSNSQNAATSGPDDNEPYYYPTPGLSEANSFRGGDTVTDLTGVFEYSFGAWKLRPVSGADYTFAPTNPRPEAPAAVGGLKVASFNVLNYFATIDTTASGSSGPCGPAGTADCRGADSEAERVRQLDKVVAALTGIDADVVGLIEIQNDTGAATEQIVEALNAEVGAGTYDAIDTGFIGTDAIKQALLFKPASVTPFGAFATLTTADDERFLDTRNRPALIQTFDEIATGERVTVAVNHFKSKGSGCGADDDSVADGSGNCDGTRTAAAQALADYLATDPTDSNDPDFLVIGDLNSYSMERPITALKDAGYTDLLNRFEGPDSYGYLFDGQLGNLDHALASSSLNGQVAGAGGWDINADELPLLDYNDTVGDIGEASFERKSNATELYAPNAYRSSDHDPVNVGLLLGEPAEQPLRLTLLHNNDGESALLPVAPRGGIARFGTLVEELRTQGDAEGGTLLLSSGDNFLAGPQLQASLENYDGDTDYSDDGPFYDAVAMDYLGYDASAVGNHEFDFGPQGLGYFISQFEDSNIRFVSSNLDVTGDAALEQFVAPSPGTPGTLVEWTRTDVEGRSVAIVGATTPRLPSITSPGPDVEAREDVQAAVQDAIDAATADGTDVVVLIAHLQNIAEDQALVTELTGIDAVIAGGGDELLANPDDVLLPGAGTPFGAYPLLGTSADAAQVPIVTTQGSYGYLGRLILDIDEDGEVTAIDDRSGPVRNVCNATTPPADQKVPDPFLVANVEEPVAAFTAGLRAEVVAQSDVVLDARTPINRTQETNLGSLFADALRVTAEQGAPQFGATNPTVALQNSGGIRSDSTYGPGPISRFDTFQIAPFSNFVGYTLDLSPEKLKQLLERSVSANVTDGALQPEGRFGQLSGIELVYDPLQQAQVVTRNADGSVTVTTAGQRVRQVTLTNNTEDTADDLVVVRNGVVVEGATSVDLAANSFTVGQNGDNYPFNLTEGQFVNLPTTYQRSLEDYLRSLGTVTAANYPVGGLGRIAVGGDVVIVDPEPEPEPTRPPGRPEVPGKPANPGKPVGTPGRPEFPGKPANPGKPVGTPGRPEVPGKPADPGKPAGTPGRPQRLSGV